MHFNISLAENKHELSRSELCLVSNMENLKHPKSPLWQTPDSCHCIYAYMIYVGLDVQDYTSQTIYLTLVVLLIHELSNQPIM